MKKFKKGLIIICIGFILMSSNMVTAKDSLEDSIEPYVITACP